MSCYHADKKRIVVRISTNSGESGDGEAVFRLGREREWWDLNSISRQREPWIASNLTLASDSTIHICEDNFSEKAKVPACAFPKKMAPVTRNTANNAKQLENESTTPKRQILRLILKPREVPTKNKQPFSCIYCNNTSFVSTELDFSRKVGHLKCENCGAEFKHKITENMTCAGDVLAALLEGDRIRWMTAKQGPADSSCESGHCWKNSFLPVL